MPKNGNLTYQQMDEYFEKKTINYFNPQFKNVNDKLDNLQNQLNGQKLLSAVIGGVGGIIAAILSPFKI